MKAGLEVHQQLATGKLFCRCPTELTDLVQAQITRQLRATGGELHTVDPAAAFQASRGWTYVYETGPSNCLVEVDEEPPHPLNPEALAVALTVALMLHARPVDEIEVMRKIVVDGSNTTGFQRTALIALDGSLELGGKRYSIPTICLEEDAARKVGEGNGQVRYRLDRLGVPLIEIATGPEITNGAEARAVAAEIGALLRSTQRVRRGIGTIREDLNVSTEGGARIEIKGVQELRLLNRYAELEEKRQRSLLELRERLRRQGASRPLGPVADLTEIFRPVTSGALALASRPNRKVLGLVLPGFASMLGTPDREGGERLGRELADQARSVGLKGIVHSDELPNGQVTEGVVAAARQALGCTPPMRSYSWRSNRKVRERPRSSGCVSAPRRRWTESRRKHGTRSPTVGRDTPDLSRDATGCTRKPTFRRFHCRLIFSESSRGVSPSTPPRLGSASGTPTG